MNHIVILIVVCFFSLEFLENGIAQTLKEIENEKTREKEIINLLLGGLNDSSDQSLQHEELDLENLVLFSTAHIDELIRDLTQSSNTEIRLQAARTLGTLGAKARRAVPNLRVALSDQSDYVRIEAAKALGLIGPDWSSIAVQDILPLFGDDNLYVRRAASESIALLKDKAIPSLLELLEHHDPEIRYRASSSFSNMRGDFSEALESALESDNVFARREATRAFARYIGPLPTNSVPKLVRLIRDKDKITRDWNVMSLIRSASKSEVAKFALLGELESESDLAFEIVVQFSEWLIHENYLQMLLKYYESSKSQTARIHIVRCIGMAGYDGLKAMSFLIEASRNEEIGYYAAEALFRIAQNFDSDKSEIESIIADQEFDGLYPGYREDLILASRTIETEGPRSIHSPSAAIVAGARLLRNVDLIGKTKPEVFEILPGLRYRSFEENGTDVLAYSFDSGFSGVAFKLYFENGLVDTVKSFGIN